MSGLSLYCKHPRAILEETCLQDFLHSYSLTVNSSKSTSNEDLDSEGE